MKDTTTVYQHGTLAMLVVGLFEGTLPVSELMKHGDGPRIKSVQVK
jgi:acetolactate decarboxylase